MDKKHRDKDVAIHFLTRDLCKQHQKPLREAILQINSFQTRITRGHVNPLPSSLTVYSFPIMAKPFVQCSEARQKADCSEEQDLRFLNVMLSKP